MFANITPADKEAFFGLLDEYFAMRGGVAAMTAAKGPAGQAALGKLTSSAGQLKSNVSSRLFGAESASNSGSAGAPPPPPPSHHASSTSAVEPEQEHARPSFAALRGAFASAQSSGVGQGIAGSVRSMAGSGKAPPPPPPAPRNAPPAPVAAAVEDDDDPPPPIVPRRTVPPAAAGTRVPAGLQGGKHFGSGKVDLTSGSTMVSSIFGGGSRAAPAATPSPPPVAPRAPASPVGGAATKSSNYNFAPPPIRRAPSSVTKAPTPEPEPEQEEGEWAVALYEYESDDKNDLHFPEGARIKITERTSDDWWTGELNGKQGLFPSTYVKLQ